MTVSSASRVDAVSTMIGLLQLCRPINTFMGILAIFVGIAVASQKLPLEFMGLDQIALHVAGGFFIASSIMILNDVVDYEIDKINAPWRPIPSGRVGRELARRIGLLAAIAGFSLSLLIEPAPKVAALALIVIIAAQAYNFYLKRTPLLGNLVVAFITALPIAYGGVVSSHYLGSASVNWLRLGLIWVMVFFAVLGREIVKSIADIEGDRAKGAKTIAVMLGAKTAASLASIMYAVAVAASLAIAVVGMVDVRVYLPAIAVVNGLALLEVSRLLRNPDSKTALSHKNKVLYLMLIALVVIYISSV